MSNLKSYINENLIVFSSKRCHLLRLENAKSTLLSSCTQLILGSICGQVEIRITSHFSRGPIVYTMLFNSTRWAMMITIPLERIFERSPFHGTRFS